MEAGIFEWATVGFCFFLYYIAGDKEGADSGSEYS
jgi:hypothetical protein